jgi:hypothetical protein
MTTALSPERMTLIQMICAAASRCGQISRIKAGELLSLVQRS